MKATEQKGAWYGRYFVHPQGLQHELWVQAGNVQECEGLETQSSQLGVATQIQVGNSAPAPGQPEISKEFGYFRDSWSDVFALRSYSTPCKFFWSTYILLSLLALQNSQEPKPHNLFYLTLSLNVFNLYLIFL